MGANADLGFCNSELETRNPEPEFFTTKHTKNTKGLRLPADQRE
jgi:hypothetical protein